MITYWIGSFIGGLIGSYGMTKYLQWRNRPRVQMAPIPKQGPYR